MKDTDTGSRIVNFWYKHGKWASETYGAHRDHIGPLKHLAKEAVEAQVIPADPIELADCFMLVLSATRNAGLTLEDLITAAENKLEICKTRKYPKGVNGEPIEHIREEDESNLKAVSESASNPKDGLFTDGNLGMADIADSNNIGYYEYTFGGECCDFGVDLLEKLRKYRLAYKPVECKEDTGTVNLGFLETLKQASDEVASWEPWQRTDNDPEGEKSTTCPHCEGEGTLGGNGYQCKECDGTGEIS